MSPRLISRDEFGDLFRSFAHTAWRWECQGTYAEPDEADQLRRFLAGDPLDLSFMSGWLSEVRAATEAGRRYERVRMMTDPMTDYLRFEFAVAPANAEAGEDIRVISAADAADLELPQHDFWLFDSERVALLQFGPNGLSGAEIHTDADTVARHLRWQQLAWEHSASLEHQRS